MEVSYFILCPVGWRFKHAGKRVLSHRLCRPTGCELQESPEQSCRNIQKLVQVPNHSTLQESHSISVQLCVSLFCHVTILVLYNWILLTVREILQRSLNTSCHIFGLELSSCYGLFAERSRPIQRHEQDVEQLSLFVWVHVQGLEEISSKA